MTKTFLISGDEIKFIPGTYALKHTLRDLNKTVTELNDILSTELLMQEFIDLFIYHSAVFALLMDKKFVDIQKHIVNHWIDENGGYNGVLFQDLAQMVTDSLGLKEVALSDEETTGEKKN